MMPVVNREMIILAREAEGHTLRELSDLTGISYSKLSRYESGLLCVSDDDLNIIAVQLRRPLSYFWRSGRTYPSSGLYHRKRSRVPVRDLKRIHAHVNELRLQAIALLEHAEVESDNEFHRLDMYKCGGPEGAAQTLRRLWQLPTGPIRSVVNAIESAGGVVFRCGFYNRDVDGISQWALDDPNTPPVFFVNEDIPGDRERFTLCHELGHVVMHHLPTDDIESEADRFAAEFLMPADEIGDDLRNLTLRRAAELKGYWRVSMAAVIRRAHDLHKISDRQYKNLCMHMSRLGYRKCEPLPLKAEEPELLKAILDVHRNHHRRSDEELGEMLAMDTDLFRAEYGHGFGGLRMIV